MGKVALGLIASGLLIGLTATASPIIQVDNPVYDFGITMEQDVVSHRFMISNIGDEVLEITDVSAPCGCTTTALETRSLSPGDSIPIEVHVATQVGSPFTRTVSVFSNDPTTGELVLFVTGEVVAALEPFHVNADDVQYDYTVLIDLRDVQAYEAGHLLGAINVPFGELDRYLDCLPSDALTVFYDETGAVSDAAVERLSGSGFLQARSLYGGLAEWVDRLGGDLIVPQLPQLSPPSGLLAFDTKTHIPAHSLRFRYFLLVDLRAPRLYSEAHLVGAISVPYEEIEYWMSDLPRDAYAVLYDQTGSLSDTIVQTMSAVAFTQARSLFGGFEGWTRHYGDKFVVSDESCPPASGPKPVTSP